MQTMNISLPDQLKEFVDDQVSSGRYSSVSEYVRDLIRDDEKRKAQEKLELVDEIWLAVAPQLDSLAVPRKEKDLLDARRAAFLAE